MERQIFINEMQARFNLRKPRSEKPTNLYLVCRINNKQVKLSTGVKIYPDHWNEKRQEAYISVRLSEIDNINNTIVNKKITKLKEYFIEFKHYLCMHPDEIGESMKLLKQHIYKDRMKKELQKPATFIMKQIIEAKTCAESSKKQYRSNIDKFERFLKENEIPNTWESMNLDTINRYQKQIIKENPLHPHNTLRNIIKGTIFNLLGIADKRLDIPFKWSDSNLNSFEFVKDKSNKELADNKKVSLTEEQLNKFYKHIITGTERQIKKYTEIRDLFILQCLVGQRIGDMQKFFNGDNEMDEEATFTEFKTHLANTKIDALSHITNEFLEAIGSDIRIAFSGFTVLKSGKIRDKISISLIRDGVDCGSFDKFSEGEKARVNLANILAMHKLTNVNCDDDKGLDLLILDEILEATDEQGLSNIFDALNQLQITSLVVSHGNIAEGYPYKTVVNKLNGVSYIE